NLHVEQLRHLLSELRVGRSGEDFDGKGLHVAQICQKSVAKAMRKRKKSSIIKRVGSTRGRPT
ncbi:MAG TPA: hypothetical protein VI588_02785, partial [Candidatus Gracilibacteria bacterium]|nr:hypothetical protein [Candidatus Gracilibacteria bacterium]